MKTKAALLMICLLAASVCAQPAGDPVDPVQLNEQALRHVRNGDLVRARLLLERAAVLVPQDLRVARNLQAVVAAINGRQLAAVPDPAVPSKTPRQGTPVMAPSPAPPVAPASATPITVPPAPPPIWPQQPGP